jgi:D-alanyl-lipoteichoic acid acyltransferase DltB (MBOAT superfamily)
MLIGYFKKTVVADRLSVVVSTVYNAPEYHGGLQSVIATIFFAIQIYCDFSGYTDIAIGSAKCMGIDLMQNFSQPYLSGSVREFWQRWHISLSTWFRDYVYIPLGGNRCSRARQALNIMITFTISGLWHGANWTFIIWGGLHGLFQNIETWLERHVKAWRSPPVKILRYPLTLAAVCFGWIFFRANTVGDAFLIIGNLFSDAAEWPHRQYLYVTLSGMGVHLLDMLINCVLVLLVFGIDLIGGKKSVFANMERTNILVRGAFYFVLIALIFSLGAFDSGGQFIYFQF